MEKEMNKKEEILKNALRLFREKGYDEVTIMDICRASNISKNTFYYYFDGKEALIKGIFFTRVFLSEENVIELMQINDPYEQLLYCYKTTVSHYCYLGKEIIKKAFVFNFTQMETPEGKPKPPKNHFIMELLEGIYRRAQEKNQIRTDVEPKTLIRISLVTLIGCVQIWATAPFDFDLEEHYMKAYEILVRK